jgi:hypothetical protein
VAAAKAVYAKPRGEKVTLEVVFPRTLGAFVEYRQGNTELKVR